MLRVLRSARYSTSLHPQKTALHDFHLKHGGKMVDFSGWALPVHYKEGIIESHRWTRDAASVFDVSHMMQTKWSGKDAVKLMERLTVADVAGFVYLVFIIECQLLSPPSPSLQTKMGALWMMRL